MHQTICTVVKSKGKILQNFVAFSEYMNFNRRHGQVTHSTKMGADKSAESTKIYLPNLSV